MNYGIIFSVSCVSDEEVWDYVPSVVTTTCDRTEDDDSYDYDYMGGPWEDGHHGKWVGVLDQKQFDEFIQATGLHMEDVETMGSLGVPWAFPGIAPAFSFTGGGDEGVIQDAYVTPLPSFKLENRVDDEEWQNKAWEKIKAALLERYQ